MNYKASKIFAVLGLEPQLRAVAGVADQPTDGAEYPRTIDVKAGIWAAGQLPASHRYNFGGFGVNRALGASCGIFAGVPLPIPPAVRFCRSDVRAVGWLRHASTG